MVITFMHREKDKKTVCPECVYLYFTFYLWIHVHLTEIIAVVTEKNIQIH